MASARNWEAVVKWIIWYFDQRHRVRSSSSLRLKNSVSINGKQRDCLIGLLLMPTSSPPECNTSFLKHGQSLARYQNAESSCESRTKLFLALAPRKCRDVRMCKGIRTDNAGEIARSDWESQWKGAKKK